MFLPDQGSPSSPRPGYGSTFIKLTVDIFVESFSESDTYVTLRDEFGAEVDSNDDGTEGTYFYLSSYLEPDTVYYYEIRFYDEARRQYRKYDVGRDLGPPPRL